MEEALRWIVISVGAVIVVFGAIGGLLTRVAGRWRDGDRLIELHQFGPRVTGTCTRPGGGELYKGLALYGTVRLTRYTWGNQHLVDMGFAPDVIPLLEGRAFANLKFRLEGAQLRGLFWGRKFSFEYEPPRIKGVARLEPDERVWSREA
jgi:hypothetical protein